MICVILNYGLIFVLNEEIYLLYSTKWSLVSYLSSLSCNVPPKYKAKFEF